MKSTFKAAAAAAALAFSASAWSTSYVVETQVDAQFVAANGYSDIHWLSTPVQLGIGDSISLIYNVLPGQRLELVNPTGLWGTTSMWNDGFPHDVTFNMSMSFAGLKGPAHDVASAPSATGGWGIMAVFPDSSFMNQSGPATISFTGLRFDISITGYSDGVTARKYDDTYMVVFADRVSAVPEPASAVLTLLGLGGISLSARRRSRRAGAAVENC